LQPLFKRSVAFVNRNDSDIAEMVAMWGGLHEFSDVALLPRRRMVVYREHGCAADHAGFLDAVDPRTNQFRDLPPLLHPLTDELGDLLNLISACSVDKAPRETTAGYYSVR
jgi:hypothetical protein